MGWGGQRHAGHIAGDSQPLNSILNILVHEPALALEPGLKKKRQEKPTHILSISKGKFDSSCRTKDEEIEVKENQRKSDLDSRGSDVSFTAGWRPSISQMKGTFVLKYLRGREESLDRARESKVTAILLRDMNPPSRLSVPNIGGFLWYEPEMKGSRFNVWVWKPDAEISSILEVRAGGMGSPGGGENVGA